MAEHSEETKVRRELNRKLAIETGLSMWGTPIADINANEFCPWCEREVPGHYETCGRHA